MLDICTLCEMYGCDWCNKGLNGQWLGRKGWAGFLTERSEEGRGMELGTWEMSMESRAGQTWGMEER